MAFSPTPISALSSTNPTLPKRPSSPFTTANPKGIPKDLYFNHDGSATKKLLAGVRMVAELVGVTLGPKGRNVVLQNKYGPPKIVNDGETVLKELLLVDKIITHPEELFKILDNAVKEKYAIVIVAEGIAQEALTPVIRNKLRGALKAVAIKAPAFGERKSHYLDDIAILTGATVVREEMGMILQKTGPEVLGTATKVVITKDTTLIVTDGSTREAVNKRVSQIQRLVENTKEEFQKKILNERIGRLSGGIAILQVGAQTQVELKDKQLRIEDALNASKAAIEEGVVVGGGCCLLRLSKKVDAIKELLDNEEQKIGAEIFKKALSYPAKLIAKNAGVNGSVVVEKVLSNANMGYGYNAARDCYEDLMKAGIMDPSKVVRCCLEHAASVAKTFLLSDAVVVEIKESNPIPRRMPRRRPKPPLPPMPQTPQMPPMSSMPSMPPMSMPTSGARAFGSKYGR